MSNPNAQSASRPDSVWTKFKQDDCPICDRRGWCTETRRTDGSRIVQCMHVHESSRPGFIKSKPNKRGEQCSFYCVDGPIGPASSSNGNGKHEPVERADEKTCHAAYAALSEVLGLSAEHHAALVARGLSDADITAGKFATLPVEHRGELALGVLKLVKADGITPADLFKVPGFIHRADVPMALAGRAGLLIPVMDALGTITGMVIRPDHPYVDPKTGKPQKYEWFTSSRRGGPSCAARLMCHP